MCHVTPHCSISIDLRLYMESGLLKIMAQRPFLHGLETHLVAIHKQIEQFNPSVVILDPTSNFISAGNARDVNAICGAHSYQGRTAGDAPDGR